MEDKFVVEPAVLSEEEWDTLERKFSGGYPRWLAVVQFFRNIQNNPVTWGVLFQATGIESHQKTTFNKLLVQFRFSLHLTRVKKGRNLYDSLVCFTRRVTKRRKRWTLR